MKIFLSFLCFPPKIIKTTYFRLLPILNGPPRVFPSFVRFRFRPQPSPAVFNFSHETGLTPGLAVHRLTRSRINSGVTFEARNTGEQVVRIDGTGRRPPANYPCRLYASSKGARTRDCIHPPAIYGVQRLLENRFSRKKHWRKGVNNIHRDIRVFVREKRKIKLIKDGETKNRR